MKISFTRDQQQVINLRDKNILVSAAAGSGKTAVLVERILQIITDINRPVDIDRLLIVTFTKAAAAEMRERISQAISKKLEVMPENEHLQRQATLIHNAQITTIDSFCMYLVRNHFEQLDIDPAVRVGDKGEITMAQQDVLKELLEDKFEEADPAFLQLIEGFAAEKSESSVEEMVLSLYEMAYSYPFPVQWLENRKMDYKVTTVEELYETDWMKLLVTNAKETLNDCFILYRRCKEVIEEPDGPYMYGEIVDSEMEMIEKLRKYQTYDELQVGISLMKMKTLPGKKDDSVSTEKRELAKAIRDQIRKMLTTLRDQTLARQGTMILSDLQMMSPVAVKLIDLTLDFMERFQQYKKERNLVDFKDMEHLALKLLIRPTADGGYEPTGIARGYQEYYAEIMIDEYQDSNLVQEYLLESISKKHIGQCNRFMVGDVKQSIYMFRLAMPELFMQKMESYNSYETGTDDVRIDLSQNFRSRETVLDGCNRVFEKIMTKELGGVPYEEKVRLNRGAVYPVCEEDYRTKVMIVSEVNPESEEEEVKSCNHYDKQELEAKMVAKEILSMVGHFEVKEGEGTRKAKFSDIVILFRSVAKYEETFRKVFEECGIPVYVPSKKGYFSAPEVNMLLKMLLVIDNPRQDIPLFTVLHSPVFQLTDEELAVIKTSYEGDGCLLYEALVETKETLSEETKKKVEAFFAFLQYFRKRAAFVSIRTLIDEILEYTGYMTYVTALPGGAQRRANLEMLMEKASEFEKTSFRGLFRFVRYIEHLEKYQIDYGEAELSDENADTVRIMTIHASKGLEFPICFVSGLGKQHNQTDQNNPLLLDIRLGMGIQFVSPNQRTKAKELRREVIARKLLEDMIGEEMRVLYVAMTRAKEKLILTGYDTNYKKKKESLKQNLITENGRIKKSSLLKAKSYLDWIIQVLCMDDTGFVTEIITPVTLQNEEKKEVIKTAMLESELTLRKPYDGTDKEYMDSLRQIFGFEYAYKNLEKLYTKTTVSELKKQASHDIEEEEGHPLFTAVESEEIVPSFVKDEKKVSGTMRGTAYHRIMELFDFTKEYTLSEVKESITQFVMAKKITQEAANAVKYKRIHEFLQTDLAKRMRKAAGNRVLRKEQPFVYGLSAKRLHEDFPKEETVLIQGVVDVYWEEDGELVILDYKTDRLDTAEDFLKRYRIQLDYYKESLEQITGKRVKETYLYSFHLGNEDGLQRGCILADQE